MATPTNLSNDTIRTEDLEHLMKEMRDWKKNEMEYFYLTRPQPDAELEKLKVLKEFIREAENRYYAYNTQNYGFNKNYRENYKTYEEEMREEVIRLHDQIRHLDNIRRYEENLRDMHPGLQDAWEKYQAMLRLVDVK